MSPIHFYQSLAMLCALGLLACHSSAQSIEGVPAAPLAKEGQRPSHVPKGYTLAYQQDFEKPASFSDFVFTDVKAWRHGNENDNGYLELHGKSAYKPKHRSPYNIALIKVGKADSFVLDVDMKQIGREYGHRDLCVFFGFNDPEHYYYTHIATKGDKNAHQVFVVNDKPRTPITTDRTKGVDWGKNQWKHIRVVRDADEGTIAVYFDDMTKPVQTASDKTFTSGFVGFGSFDDTGRIDNVRLWAKKFEKKTSEGFSSKP